MKNTSHKNVRKRGNQAQYSAMGRRRNERLRPIQGEGGGCLFALVFFFLFGIAACNAQIRPVVERPQPAEIKYNWKKAIAPASLCFAAGVSGNRDNASKFVRQGFMVGAALTIGFGSDPKRPAWHYLADVGIGAVGFLAGQFVGENIIFRE